MVTLSCLIVQATLFSQNTGSGPIQMTLKIKDMLTLIYIVRLFSVFMVHLIHWWLTRWLRGVASEMGEKGLQDLKNTYKDLTKTVSTEGGKKLMPPCYGWVDEVARARQTKQSMETRDKTSTLASFRPFRLKLYRFVSKFRNSIFRVCLFVSSFLEIYFYIYLTKLFLEFAAESRVKYDKYCDMNLEWKTGHTDR